MRQTKKRSPIGSREIEVTHQMFHSQGAAGHRVSGKLLRARFTVRVQFENGGELMLQLTRIGRENF